MTALVRLVHPDVLAATHPEHARANGDALAHLQGTLDGARGRGALPGARVRRLRFYVRDDARAEGGRACSWSARGGGVTQVRWSVDGNFIYTASRRSDDILCVDVRNTLGVVYALKRAAHGTNQRIRFDLEPCGAHLVTGGVDGFVRAFDLRTGEEVGRTQVSPNGACVNAVSFHPYSCAVAGSSEKFRRLACVVGERVFVDVSGDDSDSDDSDAVKRNDFGVSFWDYPTIEASWA